jgi:U4/U6.U5 tri-snRNP-associated protein 1
VLNHIKSQSETNIIVAEEKEQVANGDADDIMLPAEESEGLVFDDTSEFVRSIMYDPKSVRVQNTKPPVHKENVKDEDSPSPSPERERGAQGRGS